MTRLLATAHLLTCLCAIAAVQPVAASDCDHSRYKPEQFVVAIDRPTGIAFIRSPCGWEYLGVVARESIDEGIRTSAAIPVPRKVLTAELKRQPWLAGLPGWRGEVTRHRERGGQP